jgi:hypothetical protein
VFEDVNSNGVLDPGEPGIEGIEVLITESEGNSFTLTTDEAGMFMATTLVGPTVIDINASTLPPGSVQTVGTVPTTLEVPQGGTATAFFGYKAVCVTKLLEITKFSNKSGGGQALNGLVTIDNGSWRSKGFKNGQPRDRIIDIDPSSGQARVTRREQTINVGFIRRTGKKKLMNVRLTKYANNILKDEDWHDDRCSSYNVQIFWDTQTNVTTSCFVIAGIPESCSTFIRPSKYLFWILTVTV